jgi:hypothetical protein
MFIYFRSWNQQNIFLLKPKIHQFFLFFQKDKILQWVLGHITKIQKDLNNFIFPYMIYNQNVPKSSYGLF